MLATITDMPDVSRGVAYPLYERVQYERALRGWSTTRLHSETKVSRSTIAKWKTQRQPPQPGTVNQVADKLGIPRVVALRLAGVITDAPADDDRPELVRAHWDDPAVREVWELRKTPREVKLGAIADLIGLDDASGSQLAGRQAGRAS